MKIFNSIASFLYGKGDSFKIQSYNQVIIFRLISLITIGFLLVYGLDEAFTTQETLLLITHFTALGLIFINLLIASQK